MSVLDPPVFDPLAAFIARIAERATVETDPCRLMADFCNGLLDLGVPLHRGHCSMPTRRTDRAGNGWSWTRGNGVTADYYEHGSLEREPFLSSPFYHMLKGDIARLRRHLEAGERDFPILEQLHAGGGRDYIAFAHYFHEVRSLDSEIVGIEGALSSWTTDRAGGYSQADLAALERTVPHLVLGLYRIALSDIATSLLGSYLGAETGRHILMGATHRGAVRRRDAVIMLTDLRGFTALSDASSPEDMVALLDAVFEVTTAPVEARGGEILKFLGDGMLALFPLDAREAADAADAALEAAGEILSPSHSLAESRRAEGLPTPPLDIVLHLGTVMHGNVGSANRVEFTVIGPAVNEASRIEKLCEPLGRHLLISESFAAAHRGKPLTPLGTHSLRGVALPQAVYGCD